MECLNDHVPLYTVFDTLDQHTILNMILNILSCIHNVTKEVDNETLMNDVMIETYDKIKQRLDNVMELISSFDILYVNNVKIEYDADEILNQLNVIIREYFKNKHTYHVLHGDCNFSNIMFNKDDHGLKFIDPRGYFGKTKIFGVVEYDYSKIAYALSGYDMFNNQSQSIQIQNQNIVIPIAPNVELINWIADTVQIPINVLMSMTIIHWFGLTDYNKNDIAKCVMSYYYATYLYHIHVCKA